MFKICFSGNVLRNWPGLCFLLHGREQGNFDDSHGTKQTKSTFNSINFCVNSVKIVLKNTHNTVNVTLYVKLNIICHSNMVVLIDFLQLGDKLRKEINLMFHAGPPY